MLSIRLSGENPQKYLDIVDASHLPVRLEHSDRPVIGGGHHTPEPGRDGPQARSAGVVGGHQSEVLAGVYQVETPPRVPNIEAVVL